MIDRESFETISNKYSIFEKMGYDNHQIKIWIMAHMDIEDAIDQERFGKFSCKSFMAKGKSYQDLLNEVESLVSKNILFVEDRHASIKKYRFRGEAQYEFQRFMLDTIKGIHRIENWQLKELFEKCLKEENEYNFLNHRNLDQFFSEIQTDDNRIRNFFKDFLIQNASSYGTFLLSLILGT